MNTIWLVTKRYINPVLAALVGGYLFTWGFTMLGITALVAVGVAYDQAQTTLMLLAFLTFLVAFLWSFTASSRTLVWLILAGGGTVMTLTALGLQQLLLQGGS